MQQVEIEQVMEFRHPEIIAAHVSSKTDGLINLSNSNLVKIKRGK